ncbi:MAG TPA: hypothetical protein DCE56_39700 [Cyanobacteria bacterium UBA8553]|nr:hypothetical protein [Cyanobacteria bacterium UBA8553]
MTKLQVGKEPKKSWYRDRWQAELGKSGANESNKIPQEIIFSVPVRVLLKCIVPVNTLLVFT